MADVTVGELRAYRRLRRGVGIIGILLPAVLALGEIILFGGGLQPSISAYYYTGMRDVLVGSLWAIGVFLIYYRYETPDNWISTVAGILAIVVALFPTVGPKGSANPVNLVHAVSASLLFVLLAGMSLFLFTRSGPGESTPEKRARNVVYRVCGVTILLCVAGGLADLVSHIGPPGSNLLFWLETVAIMTFGLSWLVKGAGVPVLEDSSPALAVS